uniref:Myb-like transcription factor family protein n=1 Tax=Carica papaya TaxID=3649 RepID=T1SFX3_CARPA|nr:myb-like transcription factor family protein [Carica papaya]
MVKESPRKCGRRWLYGHNSRTCKGNGGENSSFRLFGADTVENKEPAIVKKSQSSGDLQHLVGKHDATDCGYSSDSQINSKKRTQRKKEKQREKNLRDEIDEVNDSGLPAELIWSWDFVEEQLRLWKNGLTVNLSHVFGSYQDLAFGFLFSRIKSKLRKKINSEGDPWREEEGHRLFLAGLEKMGKGDWIGISKKFVKTRTRTQIASHAQNYFHRLALEDKSKRRAIIFDISLEQSEPNVEDSSHGTPESLPQVNEGMPVMEAANAGSTPMQSATTVEVTQQASDNPPIGVPTHFPLLALVPASDVSDYRGNEGGRILMTSPSPFVAVMNYGIPTSYVQLAQKLTERW